MLVFLALGNAKVLSFALADAKVPNASSFASQWNIGLQGENPLCHATEIISEIKQCDPGQMPSNPSIKINCMYIVYPLRDNFISENGH